jgi:cysteine desulfurase
MGYPEDEARGALRLSLGRTTTEAEIDEAVTTIPRVLTEIRRAAAVLATDPLGQAAARVGVDGTSGAAEAGELAEETQAAQARAPEAVHAGGAPR